jgi:RNA polymerase sigma-70 factor (ECF subfamily)
MPLTEINYTSIDKNNFKEIYLYYFPRLLCFAREYVILQEDAENIVQDVFLLLWEKRDNLQIQISLAAFLFTLIKNRCIDHLRRKTNVEQGKKQLQENYLFELKMKQYSLEALDQSVISDDNIEKIITNAIDSLPPKCREIFLLNKMEGKKYREIADDLNISVNTVENQMGIAFRKLRVKLKNSLPIFLFLF